MTELSCDALEGLRNKIDTLDNQLIGLLAQRLDLVAQVGVVKNEAGVPIYAPEREKRMLQKRRQEADEAGIGGDLIEDILRRLMRESYHREKDTGFKCLNPQLKKAVVIGGAGKLGKIFVRMLQLSQYKVDVLERDDWPRADEILAGAGLVIVSVPIYLTQSVIERLTQLD